MKPWIIFVLSLIALGKWLVISPPLVEQGSSGEAEIRLPSSLLENRLAICENSVLQKQGCEAALRYLEELSDIPTLSFKKEIPSRFRKLKAALKARHMPEDEWVSGAFNAWLLALDPHAKLMAANDSNRRASAEKIFVQGAGARLRFHKEKVYVGYSMEGSAAESIGLRAGDRVLSLNGKEFSRMSETSRRRWLSQTQSPYAIQIERNSSKQTLLLAEKRYYLANVESSVRTDAMGRREGLLRVRSFDKENTCADLSRAIQNVSAAGATLLRLNLSDNPGGLVKEAQCAAGLLLGKGKIFARLRKMENPAAQQLIPAILAGGSYGEENETVLRTENEAITRLPLQVEINQNSASAAEMLAAALQDAGRAILVGSRTFGKGSMQSVFHPWGDESLYLTRTTHLILRPTGKQIQFEGITPDIVTLIQEGENFPRERELTL